MSLGSSFCILQSTILLIPCFLALTMPVSAGAGELQWQRGRTPDARRVAAKRSEVRHRDGAVRLVQYEEVTGPSFGDSGGAQFRSVVVHREESTGGHDDGSVRTAQQLEFGGAQPDSRYEEEAGTPFVAEPQEVDQDLGQDLFPPSGEPSADQPSLSDEELSLPPSTDEMTAPRQPAAQPPRTFEPRPRQPEMRGGRDSFDAAPLPRDTMTFPSRTDSGPFPNQDQTIDEGSCEENLAKLKASTLHDVDLAIGVAGVAGEDFPVECSIDDGQWHPGRHWPHTIYMWKASALCHKPLYFEDEALERYGHSWGPCCDPIVSGAHFFSKLAVLPYCMGLNPPCECQYALGQYRPGSCAPYMCDPIPIMSRASLIQAGAVVGTAALLP